jgi:predicted nucleic acid-binding protein
VTRALADTSLFIAREAGRTLAQTELPDELAISVISIGELRAGVLSATDTPSHDLRLATLAEAPAFDAGADRSDSRRDLGAAPPAASRWRVQNASE